MRIAFAGHHLDLRRRELRRAGEVVHVEPQVFDLLLHLVRNRDRVVGKDELFDTVWNGRIVSETTLSSRINAARKAIGDDGERQALIKTAHKRGFRFVGEAREIGNGEDGDPDALPRGTATPAAVPPTPAAPSSAPVGADTRKPSVVVMPFANRSPEPDTEYFGYGLTEDIIRLLARNRWLDVLSRHSGLAFRDRDASPQEIGAALRARYIVQGSVAKGGGRVRIGADLVSAETGRHLWSETYELDLADLLAVQEAMAEQIAATIEPELSRLEREAAMRKPPNCLDAWDCYQRGLWSLWGFTTPGFAEAEAMFRRAIALDPGFARAHGSLAYVKVQAATLSDPAERPALVREALRMARTAVALDDRDCMNQCVLGRALVVNGALHEGVAALQQSVALNPSFAQGYFALAQALALTGREYEAIALLERATELSPYDPHLWTFHAVRAMALISLGDIAAAAEFARRAVRHPTASYWPRATLVACLGLLGRTEEVEAARDDLLSRMPEYTVARAWADFAGLFSAPMSLAGRIVEGLRRAGVPEGVERVPAEAGSGLPVAAHRTWSDAVPSHDSWRGP